MRRVSAAFHSSRSSTRSTPAEAPSRDDPVELGARPISTGAPDRSSTDRSSAGREAMVAEHEDAADAREPRSRPRPTTGWLSPTTATRAPGCGHCVDHVGRPRDPVVQLRRTTCVVSPITRAGHVRTRSRGPREHVVQARAFGPLESGHVDYAPASRVEPAREEGVGRVGVGISDHAASAPNDAFQYAASPGRSADHGPT